MYISFRHQINIIKLSMNKVNQLVLKLTNEAKALVCATVEGAMVRMQMPQTGGIWNWQQYYYGH